MTAVTDAEWEIMRVLWAHNESTSREIITTLADAMNWKPATIKTLLGRLKDKGMVHARRDGRQYIYRAVVTEEEILRQQIREILAGICRCDAGKLVSMMLTEATLSKSDIDYLIGQLEAMKKVATETVSCQCLPGQCRCHSENK